MDPQLKSTLTSFAAIAAGAVASWAATKGFITPDQQSALTTAIVTVGSTIVGGLLVWYKARQLSQKSMIQAVNAADNGVKVVASTSTGAPAVSGPLK